MLSYEKFSMAPVKVRILYIKKLLNELGYNINENFKDDKQYKKALINFQKNNNFAGNCIISESVFYTFKNKVKDADKIWKSIIKNK